MRGRARGPVRANEGEYWSRMRLGALRVWMGEESSLSTEPDPRVTSPSPRKTPELRRSRYLITSSPSQSVNLSSPCSSVAQLPLIETSLKLVANTWPTSTV